MLLTTSTDKQVFTQLAKIEQGISAPDIIEKCPIIMSLQTDKVSVIRQIIRIIEFFLKVTGKEMEGYQVQILAGDLYEVFRTDTLEDVILLFKMARQSKFGKIYRGDLPEIMSWVPMYFDFKSYEREKLVNQKKPEPQPEETPGKKFHELPQELQDKFNNLNKKATTTKPFMKPKAQTFLTRVKEMREIEKLIEEDEK